MPKRLSKIVQPEHPGALTACLIERVMNEQEIRRLFMAWLDKVWAGGATEGCMGLNPLTVSQPSWLDTDTDKRLLNRTAVTITKCAKLQGATYQMKEAIDAIHAAFQRCDGTDPYDGLPLASRLLAGSRSPTVSEVRSTTTTATFEILSLQTKEAKGERNAEEFIAHCRAVVAHADTTSTTTR